MINLKKVLLIAEKPSLMRDIKKAYESLPDKEKEYEITYKALVGHILELKSPSEIKKEWKEWTAEQLPMIPNNFNYNVKEKKIYDEVKVELLDKGYDFVINACDAGREGELIFYSVYRQSGSKLPVKRLWINETTAPTIIKGIKNLIDGGEMENLRRSSELRSYADWLSGMNFSRAVTISSGDLMAVGRVMTPTLAIVARRHLEIQGFNSKNFYEIEAIFNNQKLDFPGTWFALKTKETRLDDRQDAQNIIDKIKNVSSFLVHNLQNKEEKFYAPGLHSLLELQKEAGKVHSFTAEETLKVAQSLYEGKFITYPRTESQCLPENFENEIREALKAMGTINEYSNYTNGITSSRIKEICINKKYVNNKKLTDHHAIIPTSTTPNFSKMNEAEKKIYDLILKRFLSIFLEPQIVNKTLIIIKAEDEYFKCTGNILKQEGYKELYKTNSRDTILPNVQVGEKITLKDLKLLSKKTSPPELYDDSSLLQAMKDAGKNIENEFLRDIMKGSGLGTSATRASIIEKLIKNRMLERKGKKILPTDFGIKIIKTLEEFGSNIVSPELTAIWEEKLEEIEEGKLEADVFYKELVAYIKENVKLFLSKSKFDLEPFDEKCPNCKSTMNNSPKLYKCSKCEFKIWKTIATAKITREDAVSLIEGKEVEKKMKKKDGTGFTANLYYDKDKNEVGFVSGGGFIEIGACPKCKKAVLEKNKFYTCEDYPNHCDFLIGKTMCEAHITREDVELLLKGKKTKVKKMRFKSGKDGRASLKLNGAKIEFEFEDFKKKK
jgi:DNA topoisomerase III